MRGVAAPLLLIAVTAVTGPCSAPRDGPRANPTSGYAIEVSESGGPFVSHSIGADGQGCEMFAGFQDAERTCYIAKEVIPTKIGGEAYGELNARRTPALDALIWRARAEADPTICAAGGLLGPFLAECERHAVADDYEYLAGSMRIRVPIGGAGPVTSPP